MDDERVEVRGAFLTVPFPRRPAKEACSTQRTKVRKFPLNPPRQADARDLGSFVIASSELLRSRLQSEDVAFIPASAP
jgi:hypothetical protein